MSETNKIEVSCEGDPDKIISAIRSGLLHGGFSPERIVLVSGEILIAGDDETVSTETGHAVEPSGDGSEA